MNNKTNQNPIFSLLSKPLSPIIQPIINSFLSIFINKYPRVAEVLKDSPTNMLLTPIDLPFQLLLESTSSNIKLHFILDQNDHNYTTRVQAYLSSFIKILEGKLDGDTLFFSREMTIDGNTACIVALRNALEAEDIDIITNINRALGPFSKTFMLIANIFNSLPSILSTGVANIKSTLLTDLQKQLKTLKIAHSKALEEIAKL